MFNIYKILIVEDDMVIAKSLKNHLCKWSYEAEFISDFKDITTQVINFDPQLILLDISLPFFNGYHWCSEVRKISKVPIIFISSMSDNMNVVMAINMGGDDYITKPFDLNIVVAKVQALMRRTYSFSGQMNVIEHNGVVLNINDNTIEYKNNKIELTKNEFKIIQILLENKSKSVSRDDIMIRLWESDSFIDDNTLTVNITRLRKKLLDINIVDFIKTKKGIGYMVD